MHEAPLTVPEIDSRGEMAQDRIERALRAKSAASRTRESTWLSSSI